MAGAAQYQWNCSVPNESGEWYIPGFTRPDFESNVLVVATAGDSIHWYRVQNLNAECFGEVTAIDFCYRYTTTGEGEAVFNWTVLILDENAEAFTITRIYTIESHPDASSSEAECVYNDDEAIANCCDREYISNFNVETNNFVFGVIESAQGNTHRATLMGFHDSLSQYIVDTLQLSATGRTVDIGSALPKPDVRPLGLRLLQFVVGEF